MKRNVKGAIFVLVFMGFLFIVSASHGQVLEFQNAIIFKNKVIYNHESLFSWLERNQHYYDYLAEQDFLDKKGNGENATYEFVVPLSEKFGDGVLCYEVKDNSLKWFGGKKHFGWDKDGNPVEPIEIEYVTIKLKKGKKLEKTKVMKRNSNGYVDQKNDLYKGKNGCTLSFGDREKPETKKNEKSKTR